jgi:hypothetical protein
MQGAYLAEQAVDAVTNAQKAGFRLKMYIGCATFNGVGEQCVN